MKQMSEKDKAVYILKNSKNKFDELSKSVRKLSEEVEELRIAIEYSSTLLRRVLNEEAIGDNVHKDCEYYNSEKDYCSNYMMGRYTGLAFEVSRHDKCIDDLVKELKVNESCKNNQK